ncbi:MAG: NrfD/PsrC family molybdoenzyme membrane anchor subunit [Solirubrobacteraceae bacterium]
MSERDSYYGRAILKEPVWTWEIPTYFFTGGLAGASATLGWAAQVNDNQPLAGAAWSAALGGIVVSPALLISDLGQPKRFLNMLRMFKLTSPMSVGSWVLAGSGAASTAAFARARLRRLPRLGKASAAVGGAILGPALCTYTAVLVSDTAVPAWHEARLQLPFVFAGGSIAAAGAAACIFTPPANAAPARRLAIAGATIELLASQAMERHLGELGEPYHEGRSGRFARAAKSLSAAGAAAIAARGSGRTGAAIGGTLVLAGSLCERFAVYHAGFRSARDPRATVGPQRARK